MKAQPISKLAVLQPQQAADFVSEMLCELAELSRKAGLQHSGDLIESAIPVLALESEHHQSSSLS
jgi:hypothetical protein